MNGIHDMGGMHGFGPVEPEPGEPVFHHDWEGRVLAIVLGSSVRVPGGLRHNIEQLDPAFYLQASYYEKWLHGRIKGFVDAGVLTHAELEARMAEIRRNPDVKPQLELNPEAVQKGQERIQQLRQTRSPHLDGPIQPRFSVGETVRACNHHPPAHTRLPRYVRGKRGVVQRFYGLHLLQDTPAPHTEPERQAVYAVQFTARELWGDSAESNGVVVLDMWESYLQPG